MLTLLLLLSALADDVVTVDGATWRALQPPRPPEPVAVPDAVLDRRVTLRRAGEAWALDATWTVRSAAPRDLLLAGPLPTVLDLRVGDRPASGAPAPDGLHLWVPAGTVVVRLAALVPAPRDARTPIDLLPAVRGVVHLPDDVVATVDGTSVRVAGGLATGAGHVVLGPRPPVAVDARPLAVARAALGVTVGDGSAAVHGRATWLLRRGRLDVVRLAVDGAGPDLRVTGPDVARTERAGDVLTVRLHHPADRVDLDVRWTVPLPAGDRATLPLPALRPLDVDHVDRAVTLARDTDLEVAPTVRGVAVLPEALPDWADGLVDGEPAGAWTGEATGEVAVLRYVPVEQPPVMIDLAELVVAVAPEGRTVIAATLSVRNERGASLEVRPPPGATLTGVAVGGVPAPASRVGDVWRVALPRSVETVQGLLSFPVELTMLGTAGDAWDRRVDAALPLPRFDAPVAVRRVTLNLPRGWTPDVEVGREGAVDAFSEGEGLAYGFGVADEARAVQLYQEAVQGWMENDLAEVDAKLQALEALGADNQNVLRLRSNVDAVRGKEVDADEGAVRRIREQAQARAFEDYRKQDEALREAKDAEEAGDNERAAAAYGKVAGYADKLSALEQSESVRQETYKAEAEARREVLGKKAAEKTKAAADDVAATPSDDRASGEEWRPLRDGSIAYVEAPASGEDAGPPEAAPAVSPPPEEDGEPAWGVEGGVVDLPPERTVVVRGGRQAAGAVAAQPAPPPPPAGKIRYRETTTIDFEGVDVEGELVKPSGALLMSDGAPPPRRSDVPLAGLGTRGMGVGGGGVGEVGVLSVGGAGGVGGGVVGGALGGAVAVEKEAPLDVTATGVAAVVPVVGETVRFQHLLLDPDDDVTVHVVAHTVPPRRSK